MPSDDADPGRGTLEARGRTALHRVELSRPVRLAMSDRVVEAGKTSVLDYGCGRGGDVRRLAKLGVKCQGWDPNHRSVESPRPADVVNLGFVVNVIEDPVERAQTLLRAWSLAGQVLVVSARLVGDSRDLSGESTGDGLTTVIGTFQKLYTQTELRAWIEATLQREVAVAAPGVFYVFRHLALEQSWLARRVRATRRLAPMSRELLRTHEDLLRPLIDFFEDRGRLPRTGELKNELAVTERFGTVRAAFAVVRRATNEERWDRVRDIRAQDLLVYLALSRFTKRPKLSDVDEPMRFDIRDLFGSYVAACNAADQLLFEIANRGRVKAAISAAPAGKKMPAALYVHMDAVGELRPVLRVLDGAARTFIGDVGGSTILKFHAERPAISFLHYPEFDTHPHPALHSAFFVSLDKLQCDFRDYSLSANPPILHRKELFLRENDPRRVKFSALTRQEERAGLYAHPSSIGTRRAWEDLVAAAGRKYRGHRLVRAS